MIVWTRMTDPFQAALAALRQQRERLSSDLRRVNRLIEELEAHRTSVAGSPAPISLAAAPVEDIPPPTLIHPGEFARKSYAEGAKVILRRTGRPLTTREIENLLDRGGRPVKGRDPYRILYRTLMKNSAFDTAGGRWSLKPQAKEGPKVDIFEVLEKAGTK